MATAEPEAPAYCAFGGFGDMGAAMPAEMPSYCSMSSMPAVEPPSAVTGQSAFGTSKAAVAGPSLEEQMRWQQQVSAAAATSAAGSATATTDPAVAATAEPPPPVFHAEWKDLSQDHYACVPGACAADVT